MAMMTKKIFFFSMFFVSQLCFAQSVTYNHDGDVMRQYTVAEEGIGSLSPDWYYDVFHSNYAGWARSENKLAARWWMYNSIHQELGHSEQLDSSLTRRAKIEALNIADRTGGALDVAWLSEKDKITKKQEAFKKNIGLIITKGGSYADKRYWEEIYNCLSQSVNAIRDAYLPNMKHGRGQSCCQSQYEECRQVSFCPLEEVHGDWLQWQCSWNRRIKIYNIWV